MIKGSFLTVYLRLTVALDLKEKDYMENGTNTGKFPNYISCTLSSGDTEINFALLFWSIDLISNKPFRYIFILV